MQSFPYEYHCKYYKKLGSRSWPVLFTLTVLLSSYTYTSTFSSWKIKSCCDHCFPQKTRLQIIVQLYILQNYSSVRISV